MLRSKIYTDFNKPLLVPEFLSQSTMVKAVSKFIRWPVSPKVKETHFKIIRNIYPVAEFLKKRFKFVVDACVFCGKLEETVEHLFVFCPVTKEFWKDIKDWLSLKIDGVPLLDTVENLYFVENLDLSVSDLINVIILLCKYHIHCSKWKNSKFLKILSLHLIVLSMISNFFFHLSSQPKKILCDITEFLLF